MKATDSTLVLNRREALRGTVLLAAAAFSHFPLANFGFAESEGELIPFFDVQPSDPKRPMVKWQDLTEWITPNEKVFSVSHYGTPKVDLAAHRLEISGLVERKAMLTLDDLKKRRARSVVATLECSGNSSNPGFMGAIGNVKWTGVPLAALLADANPLARGKEVVFYGHDQKTEKIRDKDYAQNFARSLSMEEAMRRDVLVAYEMNGEPLTIEHGAPMRLIVPGWFGIAWVKWLKRIEVLDRRFMGKWMAREYVTIRGEQRSEEETIWRETSVGPIDVKSIVARAVRRPNGAIRFSGAAWSDGSPIDRVEISIDKGPWQRVELERQRKSRFAWTFWNWDWRKPESGEHTVVSRAIDGEGRVQPSFNDPEILLKRTYWEANQQYPRKIRL